MPTNTALGRRARYAITGRFKKADPAPESTPPRSGRVRLPREVADQWHVNGYCRDRIDEGDFYDVLFWIADSGYSIVPDSDVDRMG